MLKVLRWFTLWAGWRDPVASDIPTAVRYLPPPNWYVEWWDLRAKLIGSGLTVTACQYSDIRWYVCDAIPVAVMNAAMPLNGIRYDPRTTFAGVWLRKDQSITLRRDCVNDRRIIRHELTHALRGGGGHEATWFAPAFDNYTGPQPEQLTP